MGFFVLQFIVKQWEKPENTQAHKIERAALADRYPLSAENTFYLFDKQCVIDYQGDARLGDRLKYARLDDNTVKIDRFKLSLKNKTCDYSGVEASDIGSNEAASLDKILQYKYDGRSRVYEGGYYYWLYESVTLNITYSDNLDKNVFIEGPINTVISDLTL